MTVWTCRSDTDMTDQKETPEIEYEEALKKLQQLEEMVRIGDEQH